MFNLKAAALSILATAAVAQSNTSTAKAERAYFIPQGVATDHNGGLISMAIPSSWQTPTGAAATGCAGGILTFQIKRDNINVVSDVIRDRFLSMLLAGSLSGRRMAVEFDRINGGCFAYWLSFSQP